ncbi:unnamed protein product [Orchesella dallaii]|uniref:Transmembrane protein n=1 Tax=Orchesella dallaii TaxID=48710 RepID=A0ABP1QWQ4_9HEXA
MNKSRSPICMCAPCPGISFGDALKIIAAIELLYFVGYLLHGSYLLAAVPENNVFGSVYIICGLYYLFLTVLSWQISNAPTSSRCYLWVGNSILIQFIVFILTIIRLSTNSNGKSSDIVWILLCGFPLQCYFSWVLFVYAKSFNCGDDSTIVKSEILECIAQEPGPCDGTVERESCILQSSRANEGIDKHEEASV